MIDPENIQYAQINNNTHIKIDIIPDFETEEYDIYDEKDFKKYITDIEKDVRGSREYKVAIQYLKDNMDMNQCAFFESIKPSKDSKVHIELHHTPFTLYDIVVTVINKRIFYKECMRLEQVAKEVCKLHYYMIIGLVGLSKTAHELVHNQFLFVPTDKIFGRYDVFVQYYKEFMTPDLLDILDRIEEHTKVYNENKNKNILQQNPIKIETALGIPNTEQLAIGMSDQIKNIKNSGYQLLTVDEMSQNNQIQTEQNNQVQYNNLHPGIIFFDNNNRIGNINKVQPITFLNDITEL